MHKTQMSLYWLTLDRKNLFTRLVIGSTREQYPGRFQV
jgi:hypothetical protein